MRLKAPSLLKIAFLAYVPVIITILVMILFRAQDLADEALNARLAPDLLTPTTASEAIIKGFTIWIPGALFVSFLAVIVYHALRTYTKMEPITFFAITLSLSAMLAALLCINEVPFAPEGAFEMLAQGIGYGILVPIFYARERDRLLYGR